MRDRARIAYKGVSLPIVSADIPNAFFLGVSRAKPAMSQWQLSVRVRPLELAQQPVAALDGGIKRLLRGFLAGESLLQFVVDHNADQSERSEPNTLRIISRRFQRDLLDRHRGAGIAIVKTLRAG